jgi:hypothetical protein
MKWDPHLFQFITIHHYTIPKNTVFVTFGTDVYDIITCRRQFPAETSSEK